MTKCLERKQESQGSASLVKTESTLTPKMGEEAFKCMDCGMPFPNHEPTCPWHPNKR